jgi:CheY-like chemotaxis protein/transcriptional regulator with XRE-family HTH domain
MTDFVDWLKSEWEALERRQGEKYSARRLSMEAGLSPNTLYQLLNHPEVTPSPETCHKLADFFGVDSLLVLELAGHVAAKPLNDTPSELQTVLQRRDLQQLLLSMQDLAPTDIQLVQQLVNQLRIKRQQERSEVARGAAVALVVEDTPDARAMFVEMLKLAGLKVLEAKDGQDAIEVIKTSGAIIDVVLMDYRMPRMDGVEATKKIREHFPDLPVLFISGWDEPEMKAAAFEAGAAEYLVSPVEYDELVAVVSRVRQGAEKNER